MAAFNAPVTLAMASDSILPSGCCEPVKITGLPLDQLDRQAARRQGAQRPERRKGKGKGPWHDRVLPAIGICLKMKSPDNGIKGQLRIKRIPFVSLAEPGDHT